MIRSEAHAVCGSLLGVVGPHETIHLSKSEGNETHEDSQPLGNRAAS